MAPRCSLNGTEVAFLQVLYNCLVEASQIRFPRTRSSEALVAARAIVITVNPWQCFKWMGPSTMLALIWKCIGGGNIACGVLKLLCPHEDCVEHSVRRR